MEEDNEWYKYWFNSPYYHLLYQNRSDKEAEKFIRKICSILSIPKGSHILDLACGRGRHSKVLNNIGYKVTGIDLSKESIKYAKQFTCKNLEFHTHDMRLPFNHNYFDCIMNLFTSIGYFSNPKDNEEVIKSCKIGLKQNGTLIIDFLNSNKVISQLIKYETKTIDNVKFKIFRKIENNEIVKDISIIDKENSFNYQERVTALTLSDFKGYFRDSSLNLIHLFGDYDLSNFEEKTSNRLIMVCQNN